MDIKEIRTKFEEITSELEEIEEISRMIYEVSIYNSENGVDIWHITQTLKIQNKQINNLLEKCDILDSNILEYSLANN